MSGGDLDALIHRHLEGRLTEEEARALSERLRGDPALRRRLAGMAFDQAQLRDLLASDRVSRPEAPPEKKRVAPGSRAFLVTAAALLVAVGTALVIRFTRPETPPSAAPVRPAAPKEPAPVPLDAGAMDSDGDGRVTKDEWSAAFRRMDANGDGRVSAEELKAAGVHDPNPPKRRDPRKPRDP